MRPRDSIYLNGADALKQNCRKTVMTTVKAADRQAPPVSINPRSSLFRTLFRKYGNVFSAQVAQAGGLRFGRLSACPTLALRVQKCQPLQGPPHANLENNLKHSENAGGFHPKRPSGGLRILLV